MIPKKKKEQLKSSSISSTIKDIESRYGEGVVMKWENLKKRDIDVIPTGSVSLDNILGIGGIPRGRISEIYGPEASGKTTLALHIIAEAQKLDIECAFIDAEFSFDREYAEKIGIDVNKLHVFHPDCGEQALDIVEAFVRTGNIGLIVVDSVPALTPKAEIDGVMGAQQIGLQARLISQALRKLTGIVSKNNTSIVFINQIRMNIGITWGNPETTPGGKALKFYTSIRIEIRKAAALKKEDDIIGTRTKIKVTKNKLASPFKVTEFDILYGKGISKIVDLLNYGTKCNIIEKSGITYSYNKKKLGVGLEKSKKFLEENPKLVDEIIKKLNT